MLRFVFILLVSAVFGAIVSGVALLAYPQSMTWVAEHVCSPDEQLRHQWHTMGPKATLHAQCVKPDGSVAAADMGAIFLQLWTRTAGLAFLALLLLFGFRKRGASHSPFQVSMSANPADLQSQLQSLLGSGNVIQAIKVVRNFKGSGLKETKDLVEAFRSGKIDVSQLTSQISTAAGATVIHAEDTAERLKKLEQLRAQSLITEDEYQTKRKEILAHI